MKNVNTKLEMEMFKDVDGVTYKLCTKCLEYKPMTEEYFYKRNNVKCGFNSSCKDCAKEKETKRVRIKPFNEKGELYCQRCKTYKPVSEFYENASTTKNRKYYSNNCKSCDLKDIKNTEKHIVLMTLKYFLEIWLLDAEVVLTEVKENLNVQLLKMI